MKIALVTGSAGLIGSESVEFLSSRFDKIIGIDNNLRQYFFGKEASTEWNEKRLENTFGNYIHYNAYNDRLHLSTRERERERGKKEARMPHTKGEKNK